MNKKFLLLSAAFAMVSTTAVDAKVTGFYAGVSGTGNFAQFKVYDASSHTEGKQNLVAKPGTVQELLIFRENSTKSGLNGKKMQGYYYLNPGVSGTADMITRSILAEDKKNVAEETIYKVRPAAKIFVGYNYQIGSNFVVGVELTGGMAFGAHKYSGDIKVPDLIHFKTGKNNDAFLNNDKYPRSSIKTDIELKTRFDGDLSVRLGYLVPGTDGRLALFLRGGIGLINRELKVQLASIDPYVLAAGASAHADNKVQMQTLHNECGQILVDKKAAATNPAPASQEWVGIQGAEGAKMHALMNGKLILDLMCGYTGHVKNYGGASIDLTGVGTNPNAAATYDTVKNDLPRLLADQFLANGRTYDTLYYDNLFNPNSASKSETKFTWHVGTDAEYHFSSGLFVRASYTFKYAKGFFAGNSIPLKTYSKQKCQEQIGYMENMLYGFIVDGRYKQELSSGVTNADLITLLGNGQYLGDVQKATIEQIKAKLDDMPENGLSLGTLNSKLGLGDKSFYHEFSIGFGFKFF